jgi:hypothetical protein
MEAFLRPQGDGICAGRPDGEERGETMLKRCALLAVALLGLGSSSGCILLDAIVDTHDRWLICYQRRHWMGPECGEFYWSEWFNDPPACCDPCNGCGKFVGPQNCNRSVPLKERGCIAKINRACCNSCGRPACCCADAAGKTDAVTQGGYDQRLTNYSPDEAIDDEAPPQMSRRRRTTR